MKRTTLMALAGVLIAAAAFMAIGCGDDGDETPGTPAAPSPTAPVPTQTPDDAETPEGGVVTGVPSVDAILEVIRAGDFGALNGLVQFQAVPCTTTVEGIGGPPRCLDGETDGTPVQVIFGSSCEGFYARADELPFERTVYGTRMAPSEPLYAVYRIGGASPLANLWPDAKYIVVLNRVQPNDAIWATGLLVSDDGIVGFTDGCGQAPAEFVEAYSLTDAVIAPE